MTKKILHSSEGVGSTKEHLIPIETETGFALVGVRSGRKYEYGMVVYTGKELTPDMLAEKALSIGAKSDLGLYEAYLVQISHFKISKYVSIQKGTEFHLEYVRTHT